VGAVSALWQQPVPLVLGWLHWPRGTDHTVAVAADAVGTRQPFSARVPTRVHALRIHSLLNLTWTTKNTMTSTKTPPGEIVSWVLAQLPEESLP
jgi:hypothetical protein